MRNKTNPFKFGTIVEEEFFTDRVILSGMNFSKETRNIEKASIS